MPNPHPVQNLWQRLQTADRKQNPAPKLLFTMVEKEKKNQNSCEHQIIWRITGKQRFPGSLEKSEDLITLDSSSHRTMRES